MDISSITNSSSNPFQNASFSIGTGKTKQTQQEDETAAKTANTSASNISAANATQETSELSDEEALYDVDGDGELSVEEQAAYDLAQAEKKAASTNEDALKEAMEKMSSESEQTKLSIQTKPADELRKEEAEEKKAQEKEIKEKEEQEKAVTERQFPYASAKFESYKQHGRPQAAYSGVAVDLDL